MRSALYLRPNRVRCGFRCSAASDDVSAGDGDARDEKQMHGDVMVKQHEKGLSRPQFEVLRACKKAKAKTQREIAAQAGISLGSVNKAFNDLRSEGHLDRDGSITPQGEEALRP